MSVRSACSDSRPDLQSITVDGNLVGQVESYTIPRQDPNISAGHCRADAIDTV